MRKKRTRKDIPLDRPSKEKEAKKKPEEDYYVLNALKDIVRSTVYLAQILLGCF